MTVVTKATRVTSVAAATALVIGSVGVVLAINAGRPEATNITVPSPSGVSPAHTPATSPTPTVRLPPPFLLPNMRSLSASDLSIEVVRGVRRLRFAASLANVGPGPLLLLPRDGVTVGPVSMRPSKCCIETATRTGCFSVPATARGTGE